MRSGPSPTASAANDAELATGTGASPCTLPSTPTCAISPFEFVNVQSPPEAGAYSIFPPTPESVVVTPLGDVTETVSPSRYVMRNGDESAPDVRANVGVAAALV